MKKSYWWLLLWVLFVAGDVIDIISYVANGTTPVFDSFEMAVTWKGMTWTAYIALLFFFFWKLWWRARAREEEQRCERQEQRESDPYSR
ncbi:MAG: hypothetical protein COU34_01820 [Candidatus Magasanikbacteria bacterium CG10_big_fil_rev_8_21_14_0_10_43_9]|nr:MAG: hypothetical protein COU34_01820 [Candidatus Magasanikbacteria bacterium CG10_big_fil_rev_8_21_14_0_10_43_9]